MDEVEISFRKLAVKDLHTLHLWLNRDFIVGTYSESRVSLKRVREEYMPYIAGQEPTRSYIFQLNGADAGYIQTYMIRDYPDYATQVQVDPDTAGVDLFIGEERFLHCGYGPRALRRFLETVVFAELPATSCCVGPAVTNKIAIRAYEKAGFRYLKTISVRGEPSPEYLMTLSKSEL